MMSLTSRLIWFFSAITLSVLLGLGWILAQAVEHHFEEMDQAELITKHQQINQLSTQFDAMKLVLELEYLMPSQAGWHFMIFDQDYTPYYASSPELREVEWTDFEHQTLFEFSIGQQQYRGLTQESAYLNWHFVPLMSIDHHNHFMDYFIQILWISLLIALILMTTLGWLMIRKALAPLNKMSELAAKVSGHNLGERLTLKTLPKELRELAAVFNAMLDRLELSFQRLSQFSNDIAHELRNPINNLMIQSQVALSKVRSVKDYQDVLASNIEDYERLSRMVNDMLFLAKADKGGSMQNSEKVDLAKEAQRLVEFYQLLASERDIDIVLSGQAWAWGDAIMLERALANLIANALHYADPASVVTINLEQKEHQVLISVKNQGVAIAEKHWPHLFNRFYRADFARRSVGGVGLGLAITRSIVEAHGGEIDFISREGFTVFTIKLPVEKSVSELV